MDMNSLFIDGELLEEAKQKINYLYPVMVALLPAGGTLEFSYN